jgi:ATP-binding protein involved in chromosome partitioning
MSDNLIQEITAINVDLNCDGKCEGCEKFFDCALPQKDEVFLRHRMAAVQKNLAGIKHKIISIGGKGGVGKTLVTANLAVALAMRGRRVTVLDQVFDAPCIPRMLGADGQGLARSAEGLIPYTGLLGIQVVSMGLILPDDEAITWFHELKRGATEELLCRVVYGERDYLIIDVPAGTSSDTVNVIQYIPDMDGATVVTVPSEVSQAVAYKGISLLKRAKVPIFGVFENMGTFTCPDCGEQVDLMQTGGGGKLAERTDIPFFGSIPLDARVAECSDDGVPIVYKYPDSEPARIFAEAADRIEKSIWKG